MVGLIFFSSLLDSTFALSSRPNPCLQVDCFKVESTSAFDSPISLSSPLMASTPKTSRHRNPRRRSDKATGSTKHAVSTPPPSSSSSSFTEDIDFLSSLLDGSIASSPSTPSSCSQGEATVTESVSSAFREEASPRPRSPPLTTSTPKTSRQRKSRRRSNKATASTPTMKQAVSTPSPTTSSSFMAETDFLSSVLDCSVASSPSTPSPCLQVDDPITESATSAFASPRPLSPPLMASTPKTSKPRQARRISNKATASSPSTKPVVSKPSPSSCSSSFMVHTDFLSSLLDSSFALPSPPCPLSLITTFSTNFSLTLSAFAPREDTSSRPPLITSTPKSTKPRQPLRRANKASLLSKQEVSKSSPSFFPTAFSPSSSPSSFLSSFSKRSPLPRAKRVVMPEPYCEDPWTGAFGGSSFMASPSARMLPMPPAEWFEVQEPETPSRKRLDSSDTDSVDSAYSSATPLSHSSSPSICSLSQCRSPSLQSLATRL